MLLLHLIFWLAYVCGGIFAIPTASWKQEEQPLFMLEYNPTPDIISSANHFSLIPFTINDNQWKNESIQQVELILYQENEEIKSHTKHPLLLVINWDSDKDLLRISDRIRDKNIHSLLVLLENSDLDYLKNELATVSIPVFGSTNPTDKSNLLHSLNSFHPEATIYANKTALYPPPTNNNVYVESYGRKNDENGLSGNNLKYNAQKERESDSIIPLLQMGLIIITGIFTISFILSIFMHFNLTQRRRTPQGQSSQVQRNNTQALPNGPPTLGGFNTVPISAFAVEVLDKSTVDGFIVEPYKKEIFPESNEMCPICIEEYSENDQVKLLPCGHLYHPSCIEPWLTQKSTACPLCKLDIKELLASSNAPSLNKSDGASGVVEFPDIINTAFTTTIVVNQSTATHQLDSSALQCGAPQTNGLAVDERRNSVGGNV